MKNETLHEVLRTISSGYPIRTHTSWYPNQPTSHHRHMQPPNQIKETREELPKSYEHRKEIDTTKPVGSINTQKPN